MDVSTLDSYMRVFFQTGVRFERVLVCRRTKFKSHTRGQTKHNRSNMRKEVSDLEDTKLSLMSSGSRVVGQYVEDKLAMPQRKKHLL